MPTECAESGCPNKTDSGICQQCSAEMKYGTTSRAYDADGSRVELREGETRDDSGHSSAVNETLANADAADLETAGIDPDDVKDEDEREIRTDGGEGEERTIWDITPADVKVELSDGKVRMRERAIYNGRLRVHKALQMGSHPDPDCANLYISAESRDGADVELNLEQAKKLRDGLDECIEQTVATIEDSELEIDVSTERDDEEATQ